MKNKLLGLVVLFILIFSNLVFALSDSNNDGVISLGEWVTGLFGETQTQSIFSSSKTYAEDKCNNDINYIGGILYTGSQGNYCVYKAIDIGKDTSIMCSSLEKWTKVKDCQGGTTTTPSATTKNYFYFCTEGNYIREKINGATSSRSISCGIKYCGNDIEADLTQPYTDSYLITNKCLIAEELPIISQPSKEPIIVNLNIKPEDIELSINIIREDLFESIKSGEEKEIAIVFKNKNPNFAFNGYVETGIYTQTFAKELKLAPDLTFEIVPLESLEVLDNPCVQEESNYVKAHKLHIDAAYDVNTPRSREFVLKIKAPTYQSTFKSGKYNWEGNGNYLLKINVYQQCGGNSYGKSINRKISVFNGKDINTWKDCGSDGKDCVNGIPYAKEGESCLAIGPFCNTAKGYICERPSPLAGTICTKTNESIAKAVGEQSKSSIMTTTEGVKISLKSTPFKLNEFQQSSSFEQMSAVCSYDSDCDSTYDDADYPNIKYKVQCKKTTQITNILKQASNDQCDSTIFGKIQTATVVGGIIACAASTPLIFTGVGAIGTAYVCGLSGAAILGSTGAAIAAGQCSIIYSDTLPKGACIATQSAGQGFSGQGFFDSINNFFSGLGDSFSNLSSTNIILAIIIFGLIFSFLIRRK